MIDKILLWLMRRRIRQDDFIDAVMALIGNEVARRNAEAVAIHDAVDQRERQRAITEFEKSFGADEQLRLQ